MIRRIKTLLSKKEGQGATEYSLAFLAVVLIVVMVAIPVFNSSITGFFGSLKNALNL